MRERRQQGVADTFALACHPRLFFAGRQRQTFKGAGDQQREGFQKTLLFRDHQLSQMGRFNNHQPQILVGAAQWQNQIGHTG
ncbi:hypothetical protein D3C80_1040820 [compost metagenome]